MEDEKSPDFWRQVQLFAVNGKVYQFKVELTLRLIATASFWISLVIFCVLLAVANPLIFNMSVGFPLRILFWFVNAVTAVVLWLSVPILWRYVQFLVGRQLPLPTLINMTFAIGILFVVNYGGAAMILEDPDIWHNQSWIEYFYNFVMGVIFEAMVVVFVLPLRPDLLADMQVVKTPSEPIDPAPQGHKDRPQTAPTDQMISVGNLRVDSQKLLYLKSAEHYVEVIHAGGSDLVRASLKNIVNEIPETLGIQTHRSYWISNGSVAGVDRKNGNLNLILTNGAEITVELNRKPAVTEWVAKHGIT